MDEAQQSPSNEPPPAWPITKAEWDGLSSRSQKLHIMSWVFAGATALLGVALLCAPLLPGLTELPYRGTVMRVCVVAGVVLLILAVFEYLWMRKGARTWDALHAEIWESHGCVCPWCRERVDTVPCRKHGFTRAEQPLLLRYWATAATKDIVQASKLGDELLARGRPATGVARARGNFMKLLQRYFFAFGDPDATPFQRLRAGLPSIAAQYAIVALLGFSVWYFLGREMLMPMLSGCWWIFLFIPLSAMSGPIWKVGRLRCTKCGHFCAGEQPTRCPECGSDLTLPAAVSRTERRGGRWRGAIFLLPFLLIVAGNPLIKSIVSVLPASVQNPIYSWTRPPYGYFENMSVSTMTQAEIDGAIGVLISCSAPDGPRPIFDYNFMKKAMAAGKVPPATIERAARTVAQAELGVVRDGDAVVATVKPEFGELIFGIDRVVRLVFGGVSIDGKTWTKGADWSLFAHDLDEFWRKSAQLPALPESKLVFTGRIDGVPPGTHTVRARCWIVVHGSSWQRLVPNFDETGALVPPAGAFVYPLDLERAIDIK